MEIKNLDKIEGFEFKYYLHEEMRAFLDDLQEKYPKLMKLEEIGRTYEDRVIWNVTITNLDKSPEEKSAYYIDANIHAGEVTGSTVALYTIYYLLDQYGKNTDITELLDKFTFYIIPRISADGSEKYLTTPYNLRSSTRPWPYPDKLPGFHSEDINEDGDILLMRKEDPLGDWKISEDDPRLMIKRDIEDFGKGPYYRLFPEATLHEWEKDDPILTTAPLEGCAVVNKIVQTYTFSINGL